MPLQVKKYFLPFDAEIANYLRFAGSFLKGKWERRASADVKITQK
jgi:hypothetical protein